MKKIKMFEEYDYDEEYRSGYERDTFEEGDIICVDNRVGLIVSDKYYDDGEYGYDVYFRSFNGEIFHEDINDIEHCYFIEYSDMSAYVSIARKNNYIINIPVQYQDDFPNEHENSLRRKHAKKFNI